MLQRRDREGAVSATGCWPASLSIADSDNLPDWGFDYDYTSIASFPGGRVPAVAGAGRFSAVRIQPLWDENASVAGWAAACRADRVQGNRTVFAPRMEHGTQTVDQGRSGRD